MAETKFRVPAISPDEAEGVHQIRLNLQIPGLQNVRTLKLGKKTNFLPKFEREVDNGKVTHNIDTRSLYIRFEGSKTLQSKLYILSVKELPAEIISEKTEIDYKEGRIEIVLYKKEPASWLVDGVLDLDIELPQ